MKKNNKIRYAAFGMVLVCLAAMASGCKSEEQIQQQQVMAKEDDAVFVDMRSTLTVSGEGKVMLKPDKATVYFTVKTQDEEASPAQQANTEATAALLEAVRGAGVAAGDINTGSINVYEQYNYEKNPPAVVGYEATCELTVVVRDTDKLGDVISTAVAAGATGVRGPEYSVGDSSEAYLEALAAAQEDAKAKAEAMASAAGLRLISLPVSITEQSSNQNVAALSIPKTDMAMDSAAVAPAPAPISISDMEITARISAVYEIR